MCRSTPPTHTPSQVNYAHTNALFKAQFHGNNTTPTLCHCKSGGKKNVQYIYVKDVVKEFSRLISHLVGRKCGSSCERNSHWAVFISSALCAFPSGIAVHFTHWYEICVEQSESGSCTSCKGHQNNSFPALKKKKELTSLLNFPLPKELWNHTSVSSLSHWWPLNFMMNGFRPPSESLFSLSKAL